MFYFSFILFNYSAGFSILFSMEGEEEDHNLVIAEGLGLTEQ